VPSHTGRVINIVAPDAPVITVTRPVDPVVGQILDIHNPGAEGFLTQISETVIGERSCSPGPRGRGIE